jgi:integrase
VPNPDTRQPYHSFNRSFDTARTKAGLPDLRVHDLRHSAASFMINAGIDLFAVGRVLEVLIKGYPDATRTIIDDAGCFGFID